MSRPRPDISADLWEKILQDPETTTEAALRLFQALHAQPDQRSTASELGELLGFAFKKDRRSFSTPTISIVTAFGKKLGGKKYQLRASKPKRNDWYWILPFYSGPRPPEGGWPPGQPPLEEDTEEKRVFLNPLTGKRRSGNYFIWILRPELAKAMERLGLTGGEGPGSIAQELDEIPEAPIHVEGARRQVWVNRYERDEKARAASVKHYGAVCLACGFDFGATYGAHGEGFIHVHHLKPLSEIGEAYEVDPVEDLVPLCPNCHAMIHRGPEAPLSLEGLREILAKARKARAGKPPEEQAPPSS